MTVQTKTIGRLPVNLGDYDSTRAYGRKNRVIQYGCELESLVDNNTYAPMTWDGSETFTLDSTHWRLVSGNPEVWAAGNPKPASTGTTGDYPYNGMGRVILKKNMVNVGTSENPDYVNQLTQDAFEDGEGNPLTNTVFEVPYEFELAEDITIPANCVLEFDGGSLKGGKITLNTGCIIEGNEATIETADNTTIGYALQTLRNTANNVTVRNVNFVGHCSYLTDHETGLCAIEFVESDDVRIEGCTFTGFNKNIELTECNRVYVNKNTIKDATETAGKINGYGVLLEEGDDIHVTENKFCNIERHAIYVNGPTNVVISDNYVEGQTNHLERYSRDEGNIKICGAKHIVVTNNILKGNFYGISLMKSFGSSFGCEDVIVSNNIIKDCIQTESPYGGISIYEAASYKDIKIEGNVISSDLLELKPNRGITIALNYNDEGYTLNGISIIGNTIRGLTNGIYLGATSDINNNGIILDNNLVEDGSVGYNFAALELVVNGSYNYYKNCTQGSEISDYRCTRRCRIKGILPVYKEGKYLTGTSLINAGNDNLFIGVTGGNAITDIRGFHGQIITLTGNGAGTLTIAPSSRIKLKESFSVNGNNTDYITLICNEGIWCELSRSTGLTSGE